MKNIRDFSSVKISEIIGAPGHHRFFAQDRKLGQNMIAAAREIKKNGFKEYINKEYPNPGARTKNIIINNIGGKLYMTDGNRHSVSFAIVNRNATIGDLLHYEPELFRYWEEGYEEGGDPKYQPYDTYIPIGIDVSGVPGVRQGVDDKGDKINIIASNIAYDDERFGEEDMGRPIYQTAHTIEVEAVFASHEPLIERASALVEIQGHCGKMYNLITGLNRKYEITGGEGGFGHSLIWALAEKVKTLKIEDGNLAARVAEMPEGELAEEISKGIEDWSVLDRG